MQKTLLACLAILVVVAMVGCSGGDVTAEQQHAKKDALTKFANDHKDANAMPRDPSRG